MDNFKKAYAWMHKVQEATMFTTGISVEINRQFTPANHRPEKLDGFTIGIHVIDDETWERYIAEYYPWHGWDKFVEEQKIVDAFLAGKGIRLSEDNAPGLTQLEIEDIRSAIVCHVDNLADARDMTEGLNMPKAASLYDEEIIKYNQILVKLA